MEIMFLFFSREPHGSPLAHSLGTPVQLYITILYV